jgi:hypothetical protein
VGFAVQSVLARNGVRLAYLQGFGVLLHSQRNLAATSSTTAPAGGCASNPIHLIRHRVAACGVPNPRSVEVRSGRHRQSRQQNHPKHKRMFFHIAFLILIGDSISL